MKEDEPRETKKEINRLVPMKVQWGEQPIEWLVFYKIVT
jgi:hypothetical protein